MSALKKRLKKKKQEEKPTKMAYTRRRTRRRSMRKGRKNLKKRSFPNKMYKKGVSRALHTTAKYLFKKAKAIKGKARKAGRKARR